MKFRRCFLPACCLATLMLSCSRQEDPAPLKPVRIFLNVVPFQLKFDKELFEVTAGQKVILTFSNKECPLQHALVILKPNTLANFSKSLVDYMRQQEAFSHCYIPPSDDILAQSSRLLSRGQSEEMEFTAPTQTGDYPYVCPFPGQWMVMQGVMKVVNRPSPPTVAKTP